MRNGRIRPVLKERVEGRYTVHVQGEVQRRAFVVGLQRIFLEHKIGMNQGYQYIYRPCSGRHRAELKRQ